MSEYFTDRLTNIDPDYPLVPGDWNITFKDIKNNTMCIMRYAIQKTIPIKNLIIDGMQITSAQRMR